MDITIIAIVLGNVAVVWASVWLLFLYLEKRRLKKIHLTMSQDGVNMKWEQRNKECVQLKRSGNIFHALHQINAPRR